MHALDAKININHYHLASYNSVVRLYIIFFTYFTKTASYLTPIILNFINLSTILSDNLLTGYTLFLPQLDVRSHPMQSVGDL